MIKPNLTPNMGRKFGGLIPDTSGHMLCPWDDRCKAVFESALYMQII